MKWETWKIVGDGKPYYSLNYSLGILYLYDHEDGWYITGFPDNNTTLISKNWEVGEAKIFARQMLIQKLENIVSILRGG